MSYSALVTILRAILLIIKDSDLSLNDLLIYERYTCVARLLTILRYTMYTVSIVHLRIAKRRATQV